MVIDYKIDDKHMMVLCNNISLCNTVYHYISICYKVVLVILVIGHFGLYAFLSNESKLY